MIGSALYGVMASLALVAPGGTVGCPDSGSRAVLPIMTASVTVNGERALNLSSLGKSSDRLLWGDVGPLVEADGLEVRNGTDRTVVVAYSCEPMTPD